MGALVYLVHGTFASGAPWVQLDGTVTRLVRHAMRHVEVRPFAWSGANNHASRAEAGLALAAEAAAAAEESGRNLYFIAHSHGGNVVLHALADGRVARKSRGAAFLGTPFFDVRFRDAAVIARVYSATLVFFLPMIGLLTGLLVGVLISEVSGESEAALGLLVLFFILATLMRKRFRKWLEPRLRRSLMSAKSEVRRTVVTSPPPCPVYIASIRWDEAGLLLRFWDRLALGPWAMISILLRSFVSAYAGMVLAAFTSAAFETDADAFGELITVWLIMPTLIAAVLAVPVAFVISSVRGSPIAFGGESMAMVAAARIAPQSEPGWRGGPGSVSETCPSSRPAGPAPKRWWQPSLRHSTFYEDQALMRRVATWFARIEDGDLDQSIVGRAMPDPGHSAAHSNAAFLLIPGALVYCLFLAVTFLS